MPTEYTRKTDRPLTLAEMLGKYENSRVAHEHNLIADRALRALDGLRKFRDLPKQSTQRLASGLFQPGAHHGRGREAY
jgi:hypothetical protein